MSTCSGGGVFAGLARDKPYSLDPKKRIDSWIVLLVFAGGKRDPCEHQDSAQNREDGHTFAEQYDSSD